ncbi:MAG TPA: phosphoribosylpyrophosphate synthetase, partial [Terriglobales bacterium]|nr:phosphoribosylpyrophosphate synthetase [Terriglobales bacterium]
MATVATTTEKKSQQGTQTKMERKPTKPRRDEKFKIFGGTANQALADEICAFLQMPRGQSK